MRLKSALGCAFLFLVFIFADARGVKAVVVPDFLVHPDGLEAIPHFNGGIVFDREGNFVSLWVDRGIDHDYRQIYFQRFDAFGKRMGGPVLVSDPGVQYNNSRDIAMSPSGDFVVCWVASVKIDGESIRDIWARGFNSSGEPTWPVQQVDVERPGPGSDDSHPSIAMDKEGNFVVAWQTIDSGGRNVYAQRFDSSGERIGKNFLVSDINASNYELCEWFTQFPDVAINSLGYFFICWQGCVTCRPASPSTPLARVYNPAGEPITDVFPFFAPCSSIWDYGYLVTVASNSQNNFVATFGTNDTLSTYPNNAVAVQTFDTLGNAVDTVKIVNDVIDLGSIWYAPKIAVDSSDGYIVLWSDWRTKTNCNLWAQRFNSLGEPQGENYRINLPPGSLSTPDGAYENWKEYALATHGNSVVLSWMDYRNWDLCNTDIYAKLLDLDKIGYYLPGDVILDGNVDTADIVYLINHIFKGGYGCLPEWTGDVNADGEVGLVDVVYLINYLFKNGPEPQKGE